MILEKIVNKSKKDWGIKLDDAVWAHRIAFKKLLDLSSYTLIFRKSCHLLVELENKVYWATKELNMDLRVAGEKK